MIATSAESNAKRPPVAYLYLSAGVFAAAVTPIAIREAQLIGLPSLYIIATRLLITIVVLGPFVLRKHSADYRKLTTRQWALILTSGCVFTVNLTFLFFSLEFTSVLVTAVLRRISPLFVIVIEVAVLSAAFSRKVWIGAMVTLVGGIAVSFGSSDLSVGPRPILGAMLAIANAVLIGVYFILGRGLRNTLPSLAYSWMVFLVATVISWGLVLGLGLPLLGYSAEAYLWILLIAFLSQFLGHIPINLALHYFHATHMSVFMQLAVVISAVLAFIFFDQVPTILQIIGSLIILAGLYLINSAE